MPTHRRPVTHDDVGGATRPDLRQVEARALAAAEAAWAELQRTAGPDAAPDCTAARLPGTQVPGALQLPTGRVLACGRDAHGAAARGDDWRGPADPQSTSQSSRATSTSPHVVPQRGTIHRSHHGGVSHLSSYHGRSSTYRGPRRRRGRVQRSDNEGSVVATVAGRTDQARQYIASMLRVPVGKINDAHVDCAMRAALRDRLASRAQLARVERLTGAEKAVTAHNILSSAGADRIQPNTSPRGSHPALSARAGWQLTQRLACDDVSARAHYRQALAEEQPAQTVRVLLDARQQENLLERLAEHEAQRRAKIEHYRANPRLIDPELRFTPRINTRRGSVRRLPSEERSPSPRRYPSPDLGLVGQASQEQLSELQDTMARKIKLLEARLRKQEAKERGVAVEMDKAERRPPRDRSGSDRRRQSDDDQDTKERVASGPDSEIIVRRRSPTPHRSVVRAAPHRPRLSAGSSRQRYSSSRLRSEHLQPPVAIDESDSQRVEPLALPSNSERAAVFRRLDREHTGRLSLSQVDRAILEIWPDFADNNVVHWAYKFIQTHAGEQQNAWIMEQGFSRLLSNIVFLANNWDYFNTLNSAADTIVTEQNFIDTICELGLTHAADTFDARAEAEREFYELSKLTSVRMFDLANWCAIRYEDLNVTHDYDRRTDSSHKSQPEQGHAWRSRHDLFDIDAHKKDFSSTSNQRRPQLRQAFGNRGMLSKARYESGAGALKECSIPKVAVTAVSLPHNSTSIPINKQSTDLPVSVEPNSLPSSFEPNASRGKPESHFRPSRTSSPVQLSLCPGSPTAGDRGGHRRTNMVNVRRVKTAPHTQQEPENVLNRTNTLIARAPTSSGSLPPCDGTLEIIVQYAHNLLPISKARDNCGETFVELQLGKGKSALTYKTKVCKGPKSLHPKYNNQKFEFPIRDISGPADLELSATVFAESSGFGGRLFGRKTNPIGKTVVSLCSEFGSRWTAESGIEKEWPLDWSACEDLCDSDVVQHIRRELDCRSQANSRLNKAQNAELNGTLKLALRFVTFDNLIEIDEEQRIDAGVVPQVLQVLFRGITDKNGAIAQFEALGGGGLNGRINLEEMSRALIRLGLNLSNSEVEEVVRYLDGDDDGEISLEDIVSRAYLGNLEFMRQEFRHAAVSGYGSLKSLFQHYDTDGNGELDLLEFTHAVQNFSLSEETSFPEWTERDIEQLFDHIDTNRGGTISLTEFLHFIESENAAAAVASASVVGKTLAYLRDQLEIKLSGSNADKQLRAAFTAMDTDGSGDLDAQELRQALQDLGLNLRSWEATVVLAAMDTDGNGAVSLREFLMAMDNAGRITDKFDRQELHNKNELVHDVSDGSVVSGHTSTPNTLSHVHETEYRPPCDGKLIVELLCAKELVPTESKLWGSLDCSNPYVKFSLGRLGAEQMMESTIQKKTLEPVWKEKFVFDISTSDREHVLNVQVFGRNFSFQTLSSIDHFMGEIPDGIDLWHVFGNEEWSNEHNGPWLLKDPERLVKHEFRQAKTKLAGAKGLGCLEMRLVFVPDNSPTTWHPNRARKYAGHSAVDTWSNSVSDIKFRQNDLLQHFRNAFMEKAAMICTVTRTLAESDDDLQIRVYNELADTQHGITKDKLRDFIVKWSNADVFQGELLELWKSLDIDKDGKVSQDDFLEFMKGFDASNKLQKDLASPPTHGILTVELHQCEDLLCLGEHGEKSLSYVVLYLGTSSKQNKSSTKAGTSPYFGEAFDFDVRKGSSVSSLQLHVEVWKANSNRLQNDRVILGSTTIDIREIFKGSWYSGPLGPSQFKLSGQPDASTDIVRAARVQHRKGSHCPYGTIIITLTFTPRSGHDKFQSTGCEASPLQAHPRSPSRGVHLDADNGQRNGSTLRRSRGRRSFV